MSFFEETIFDNHELDDWLAELASVFEIALANGLEAQPVKLNAKQATHNKMI
ncbi:hypothetical protein N9B68_02000 [bacterium]|nr:hypothetical protein [bacterium]